MDGEGEEIEIIIDETPIPNEDEPQIEVVKTDEKPEKGEKPARKAKEPAEEVPSVDDEIAKLREQLDMEKNSRLEAEKRAHDAGSEVIKAKTDVRDSEIGLVNAAIETTKQNIEVLKVNYRKARETNDLDAELEATTEISKAAAILMQLENGKEALEKAPKPEAPQPFRPSDPVEALASQLSPRSAAWVRSHPEFATDNQKYSMMIAAHNLAVGRGHAADSDAYFESIEKTLDMHQEENAMSEAAKPQRRQAPPAAPVTRGGNGQGSSSNRVTLTRAEIDAAESMGMTNEEYARNKLALIREGKLTTH